MSDAGKDCEQFPVKSTVPQLGCLQLGREKSKRPPVSCGTTLLLKDCSNVCCRSISGQQHLNGDLWEGQTDGPPRAALISPKAASLAVVHSTCSTPSFFAFLCLGHKSWPSTTFVYNIIAGLGMHSFQKNVAFLRSFAFFIKECGVLCVLLRSLLKNTAFFCVLYKRTLRSLCSFAFFIKECGILCFLLHSL